MIFDNSFKREVAEVRALKKQGNIERKTGNMSAE